MNKNEPVCEMPCCFPLRQKILSAFAAIFLLLFVSTQIHAAPASQSGAFFLQQYGPKVYGQSPQNWSAAQDRRGVMFFGNTDGVLEFDGATWRKILFNGLPALSVATDSKATIYVGSQNDFGYLRPDAAGNFQFVSLAAKLAPAYRNVGGIYSISCTSGAVWFTSRNALFRWRPAFQELTTIAGEGLRRSFVINDELYVSLRTMGLNRVDGIRLKPMPGLELGLHGAIQGLTDFHGSLVFATAEELYRQENGRFVPWKTDAEPELREGFINSLLALKTGDLAIATLRRGMIILNADGSLKRIVDKKAGLLSDAVRMIFEDRQKGLWLTLDRGVARVEAESPLTSFGEKEGVGELVSAATRFQGAIYAGTVVGLSYLQAEAPGLTPHFVPVEGVRDTVDALLPMGDELIAGSANSIYSVAGGKSRLILAPGNVYDLARSAGDPDLLYAVGNRGLNVLHRDGVNWKVVQHVNATDRDFRSVLELPDQTVWIGARSAVYRINWQHQPAIIERFSASAGVPNGWVNLYRVDNQIVFATSKGVLRFDAASHRFAPDLRFGKAAADGTHAVSLIRESANGNVWISGAGYQAILQKQPGRGYRWMDGPLARAEIGEVWALYLDDDGTAWASGTGGGLVRLTPQRQDPNTVPPLLLRRVEFLKSKQPIFNGENDVPSSAVFQFADNAMRFEFALPVFEDPSRTEYQVWLKGIDHDWSAWSKESEKEYTNLYEKQYDLQIRARSLHGFVTAPAQFRFRIRPPWYRTWWSFILYFAVLLGAIAWVVRLRLSHLAAQNRRLEAIITARTSKIREQRDQILTKEKETNTLLLNILPPQVAEELRATGKVEPVACSDVAICFTDFVGFTLSSETMSAQKLVAALHTYFVAFDEVIGRYGLEKLKTIGDAYMFVGGLPQTRDSYAVDTVLAAMELVRVVEQLEHTDPHVGWKVRVGVNTGPAISGVVGSKKFAFDIWGNSVNLASRMESSGQANTVNISADTYHLVKDFVECEPRGLVRTKEGRLVEMYFARRIRPELLLNEGDFRSLYEKRFGKAPPIVALAIQSVEASSPS